jgi:hypothetical protein
MRQLFRRQIWGRDSFACISHRGGFGDINFEPRCTLMGLFRLYPGRAQEYSLLLLGKRDCYPLRRLKQKQHEYNLTEENELTRSSFPLFPTPLILLSSRSFHPRESKLAFMGSILETLSISLTSGN